MKLPETEPESWSCQCEHCAGCKEDHICSCFKAGVDAGYAKASDEVLAVVKEKNKEVIDEGSD